MRRWWTAWGLAGLLLAGAAAAQAPSDGAVALYREGRLAGGRWLHGSRDGGQDVQGAAAACVACHRRSGLGSAEGRLVVPPINGNWLSRPRSTNVPPIAGQPPQRVVRPPYDERSFARALREGVDPGGRLLSPLMPRYALGDADIRALYQYLGGLSSQPPPGVSPDVLHFATIVTPDADPVARDGMLAVMRKFFDDKNAFIRGGARRMVASREIEFRVTRRWQLHVWTLSGPPSGWKQQLRQWLQAEPVFAVVSGIGGATWVPVHEFCQEAELPCLFPNTTVPKVAEDDFYPVYFSRGVALEADLIGAAMPPGQGRLVQLFEAGDAGAQAAALLGGESAGRTPLQVTLRGTDRKSLEAALQGVRPQDTLVLWLPREALAALPPQPPTAAAVYVSGLLGGLDDLPLPPAWRSVVQVSYPVDLPEQRRTRMNFPLQWLRISGIPLTAERVQSDTYLACGILAEALSEMLDNFYRDHLLERIETMLSHRLVTGYYPRLSLAPGQRFASKGGYLVHYKDTAGDLSPVGDWTVPDVQK